MADRLRTWNIPPGRVSQRISAFQTTTQPPAKIRSGSKEIANPTPDHETTVSDIKSPEHEVQQTSIVIPAEHRSENAPDPSELEDKSPHLYAEQSYSVDEDHARGRSSIPSSILEPLSADPEDVDEILDAVRARLYSVQKMVRREQSGSSQARDEMMDELGTMLDNAIATTMTPLHSPRPPTRGSSLRRSSPQKQSPKHTDIARSQSLKASKPHPLDTASVLSRPRRSSNTSQARDLPHSRVPTIASYSVVPDVSRHDRQIPEHGFFGHRRTGFPLASPVRERALLWESMSRASMSEDETSHAYLSTRFHTVTPVSKDEAVTKTQTPPIPLALPQLLHAEKREQQKFSEEVESIKAESTSIAVATQWPGHLRLVDVGQSTPTVRQSTSFAQAAEPDEHTTKQKPGAVKTTIRDLLSATRRRVSGKSNTKDNSIKDTVSDGQSLQENTSNVAEADSTSVHERIANLSAQRDEPRIESLDGESTGKAISRKSTLKYKLAAPSEQPSSSPRKSLPLTPIRGRNRADHSPGGRPYGLDHRFKMSPSRSDSRGSRGSLTFNIKARVSPGRGSGKDDTELFVTANIESDHSDEEK